jgi:hypothetical protein
MKQWLFTSLVVGVVSAGCAEPSDQHVGVATSALTCPPPTLDNRALVENDPAALTGFGLARTLDQIRTLARTSTSLSALWTQWRTTFNQNCPGPQPCRPTVRDALAVLDPSATGFQFQPVAVFDRFDLAASDGADCGEYRIVYAADQNAGVGRGFIIFEGRLANPRPTDGIKGCIPVADFWADLATDPDPVSRGAKLETFFYVGLPGFDPVVHPLNYGLPSGGARRGQIRTDFFFDREWNLRQFQLRPASICALSSCLQFEQVKVNENPSNTLFNGTDSDALAFQTSLIGQIPRLSAATPSQIAMSTPDPFNTFESISQNSDMDYDLFASPAFRARVEAASATFTASELFLRTTTQTCAGCHELSSGDCIGPGACPPGIRWPAKSEKFVQVNESGTLSDALQTEFLPFRLGVLTGFLNSACGGSSIGPADPNKTLSGKPLDSPN